MALEYTAPMTAAKKTPPQSVQPHTGCGIPSGADMKHAAEWRHRPEPRRRCSLPGRT
jgi:hypothetical protein